MGDGQFPVPTIASSGFECEREPGDSAAVDDVADFEHDIIVGCCEVKVR